MKPDTTPDLRDEARGWCRVEFGVLPRISGGGGGQLTIHPSIQAKIHPKIQVERLKRVAAEGLAGVVISPNPPLNRPWFSRKSLVSLFFRMRLRRERTSLAPLAQAVPSPSPLPPPLNLPGLQAEG